MPVDGRVPVERLHQLVQPDRAARHRQPARSATAPPRRRTGRSSRRTGRHRRGRAGRTTAIAPPCPMAGGRRHRCAASASAGGPAGRRSRGSRGTRGPARGGTSRSPWRPTVTTCQAHAVLGDDRLQRLAQPRRPARRGARRPSSVSTSVSVARVGRHRQRVAVERADLFVAAVGDRRHHRRRCRRSRRPRCRRPAPWPGRPCRAPHPTRAVTPPGPVVKPVFTSSKISSAPSACTRSRMRGEVAVVGRDDAGVHHHRLEDHRRRPGRGARPAPARRPPASLNGTTTTRSRIALGMPVLPGTRVGCVARARPRRPRAAPTPAPSRGGRGSSPRP